VDSYSFVCITAMLLDILQVFTKLSKIFQKDTLNFHVFETQLKITNEMLQSMLQSMLQNENLPAFQKVLELEEIHDENENVTVIYREMDLKKSSGFDVNHAVKIKNEFVNEIVIQLKNRFPEENVTFLSALNQCLNPAELANCKPEILDIVFNHFSGELVVNLDLDLSRAKKDLAQFKMLAAKYSEGSQSESQRFERFAKEVTLNFRDIYPDFAVLMSFFLTIPFNSVPCERGFSAQNRIKTKFRSRLGEENLEDIMRVSLCSITPELHLAAEKFSQMKDRRK
jgi:hypothetical protein